jgi:hypothetical protein
MGWQQFITLVGLLATVYCDAVYRGGTIKVLGPENLSSKFHHTTFDHHLSSFGRVPYGHSIVGNLRIPFPETGCGENVKVDYDMNSPEPLIMIVKRSECTFLEKVQNSQKLKAAMVIIVDNIDENMDYVIPWVEQAETLNVHIPSTIVDHKTGEKLMDEVRKLAADRTSNVVVSTNFEIRQETKSNIFYKFDLNDRELYETFFDLMHDFKEVKEHIILVPIYNISTKASSKDISNLYCLNDGRFCEVRPDKKKVDEVDEPLFESIRQLCLSRVANESWWIYSAEFYKNCIKPPAKEGGAFELEVNLDRCSKDIQKKLPQIDREKLNECTSQIKNKRIEDQKDGEKSLIRFLEMNFDLQHIVSSPVKPTLMINGQIVYGRMTGLDVLKEMCASLKVKPDQCLKIDRMTDTKYRRIHGITLLGALWFFFKLLLVAIISLGGFYLVYKVKLRKDMEKRLTSEVDSALANYYMQSKANRYEGVKVDESGEHTPQNIEQVEMGETVEDEEDKGDKDD